MPVNLYYTQKVRGFQQTSVKYSTKSVEISLKRTKKNLDFYTLQKNSEKRVISDKIRGKTV